MPRARKTNRQIWRNNGSVLEGASGWPHSPKTTSCAARRSSSPTDGATPGLQPSRTSKRHRDRGHQYRPAAPVSPHGMESRTRPAGTPCRDQDMVLSDLPPRLKDD